MSRTHMHALIHIQTHTLHNTLNTYTHYIVSYSPSQALNADLVQFLLSLLESNLESCEHPSAAKAQIVKVLKAMGKDLSNGDRVS